MDVLVHKIVMGDKKICAEVYTEWFGGAQGEASVVEVEVDVGRATPA